jgi:hypothetical protein
MTATTLFLPATLAMSSIEELNLLHKHVDIKKTHTDLLIAWYEGEDCSMIIFGSLVTV